MPELVVAPRLVERVINYVKPFRYATDHAKSFGEVAKRSRVVKDEADITQSGRRITQRSNAFFRSTPPDIECSAEAVAHYFPQRQCVSVRKPEKGRDVALGCIQVTVPQRYRARGGPEGIAERSRMSKHRCLLDALLHAADCFVVASKDPKNFRKVSQDRDNLVELKAHHVGAAFGVVQLSQRSLEVRKSAFVLSEKVQRRSD